MVTNVRRALLIHAEGLTSQAARVAINWLPAVLVGRLVRSHSAIRFLARHRIWLRKTDIARLADRDFAALVRTTGLERDIQIVLEQDHKASRGQSARGELPIQGAEAEPQPGRPQATGA